MSDEVTREVLVPATLAEVWQALTEPELLTAWIGEEADRIELRPGGEVRIGDREGFVEELEPEARLTFWWAEGDAETTRVEIRLEPQEGGTLVVVEETRPLALLDARGIDLADQLGVRRPHSPELSAAAMLG